MGSHCKMKYTVFKKSNVRSSKLNVIILIACEKQKRGLGTPDLEMRIMQPTMSSARLVVGDVITGVFSNVKVTILFFYCRCILI